MKKITLLVFFFLCSLALAATRCPVCGMEFEEGAKTSFETTKEEKSIHLCSFSCAHKLHKRDPKVVLFARDFNTGKKISAQEAFFLTKSQGILKEIPFDMPPSVVAFADKAKASEKLNQLSTGKKPDGVIVEGFGALEKLYE